MAQSVSDWMFSSPPPQRIVPLPTVPMMIGDPPRPVFEESLSFTLYVNLLPSVDSEVMATNRWRK